MSLVRLFAEYKDFAESEQGPATVEAEIADIMRYAPHYRTLVSGEGNGSLGRLARRIQPWDTGTAYAPVLAIAACDAEETEREQAYGEVISYIVRRAVCGKTTKNYNNVFLGLARELAKHGHPADTTRSYLLTQQGDSGSWPNDAEFHHAWVSDPIYLKIKPVSRLNAILRELEVYSRGAKIDPTPIPDELWVEHLMPQAWWQNWPLPDGTTATETEVNRAPLDELLGHMPDNRIEQILRRQKAVHTIGNLTLHTASMGTSIGNAGFEDKRRAFSDYGLFNLTKGFTGSGITCWDEGTIRARSEKLFELAREIWPHPGRGVPL